jgi:hypothetical protein
MESVSDKCLSMQTLLLVSFKGILVGDGRGATTPPVRKPACYEMLQNSDSELKRVLLNWVKASGLD